MNKNQGKEISLAEPRRVIGRRDFLIAGAKVTLCLIACDSGILSAWADEDGDAVELPQHLDDSLNIIGAYLSKYTPPAGAFPGNGCWKATYEVMSWAAARQGPKTFGDITVVRRPSAHGISYEVENLNELFEFRSNLRSKMECSAKALPGLLQWTTDYECHTDPHFSGNIQTFGNGGKKAILSTAGPVALSETGSHANGVLEIATRLGTRKFNTDRPVLTQWSLLDALRGAPDSVVSTEFDMLHDLTSYRPHQHVIRVGDLEIAMAGGLRQTFRGYLRTGFGTEPTHYWIDPQGRPLLVTEGVISHALTDLQPA
jgi:hypothetical protein